jgi:hypothetical protein
LDSDDLLKQRHGFFDLPVSLVRFSKVMLRRKPVWVRLGKRRFLDSNNLLE